MPSSSASISCVSPHLFPACLTCHLPPAHHPWPTTLHLPPHTTCTPSPPLPPLHSSSHLEGGFNWPKERSNVGGVEDKATTARRGQTLDALPPPPAPPPTIMFMWTFAGAVDRGKQRLRWRLLPTNTFTLASSSTWYACLRSVFMGEHVYGYLPILTPAPPPCSVDAALCLRSPPTLAPASIPYPPFNRLPAPPATFSCMQSSLLYMASSRAYSTFSAANARGTTFLIDADTHHAATGRLDARRARPASPLSRVAHYGISEQRRGHCLIFSPRHRLLAKTLCQRRGCAPAKHGRAALQRLYQLPRGVSPRLPLAHTPTNHALCLSTV